MVVLEKLEIREFRRTDQLIVKDLILSGLKERWGVLDISKNEDLIDIQASYKDGVFLVAIVDGEIVGTGAILPEDIFTARIVRMSTRRDLRNMGVGSDVLNQLIAISRSRGYKTLVVETTASWSDAITFYLNRGFESQGVISGDHHFNREILKQAD